MIRSHLLVLALLAAVLWPSSVHAQLGPNTTAAVTAAATPAMPAATTPAAEPLPGARVDPELVLPVSAIPADMGPLTVPDAAAATLSPTNTTTAAANASLAAAALAAPLNATTNLTAGDVSNPHLAAAAAAVSLRDPVDVHGVGALVPAAPGSTTSDTPVAGTRVPPKATQYKPRGADTGVMTVVPGPRNTSAVAPSAAGPLNSSWVAEGDPDVITILHYNDWHQRMEPMRDYAHALCDRTQADKGRCGGGIARMKTLVDQERRADPSLLLLNAGDDFIGTVWDHKYGSKAAAHFQNRLQPDAMVVGNHEFDWGSDTLGNYLQSLSYPALGACNLDFKGHWLAGQVKAWTTKTVQGRKVCILGLTTTAAPTSEMYPVWVKDPYSSGRDCIKAMKEQHPDCALTVMLNHLGYTADVYAAKLIPGVDVVIGGHSHSFLWHDKDNPPRYDTDYTQSDYVWGDYPTWVDVGSGRKAAVVQAGWGSRYMGKLQVRFKAGTNTIDSISGYPVLLGSPNSDNPVEEDQELKQEVLQWKYW